LAEDDRREGTEKTKNNVLVPDSSFPFPYLSPYRFPKRRAPGSSRPHRNLAALP